MNQDAQLLAKHVAKVHKFFLPVLAFLLVFSLGLSQWHDTLMVSLIVALPAAIIPTILIFMAPQALITRLTVGVALMVFSGLNIHQAQGMTEFHFGVFVLMSLLLFYRDWRVIATRSISRPAIAFTNRS